MIPVIIQDLIEKVSDSKKHYEQRQHYATTLKNIVDASQKALDTYENDRKKLNR